MTFVEFLSVLVCGALAAGVLVLAVLEMRLRARQEPAPLPLVDRMIQATALRCTEAEAHAVIRACREQRILAEEVARLDHDDAAILTDAQLHRLFMMCVHRTLARVAGGIYRSQSRELN